MIALRKLSSFLAIVATILSFSACGGGSSGSGVLIEGTLTEAGGAAHSKSLILKHSEGQRIGAVEVCALGECSTTDDEGQWGFVVEDAFVGGEVLFSVKGHGIDSETVVNIPTDASDIFIDFQHVEGGMVEAHHITANGETSHNEGEEDDHQE